MDCKNGDLALQASATSSGVHRTTSIGGNSPAVSWRARRMWVSMAPGSSATTRRSTSLPGWAVPLAYEPNRMTLWGARARTSRARGTLRYAATSVGIESDQDQDIADVVGCQRAEVRCHVRTKFESPHPRFYPRYRQRTHGHLRAASNGNRREGERGARQRRLRLRHEVATGPGDGEDAACADGAVLAAGPGRETARRQVQHQALVRA